MLTNAAQSLVAAARDPSTTDANLNAAAQAFFNTIRQASREEANGAIQALSQHFEMDNLSRGAFLAVVCGALVERGCDPMAMSGPLTTQLESLLRRDWLQRMLNAKGTS